MSINAVQQLKSEDSFTWRPMRREDTPLVRRMPLTGSDASVAQKLEMLEHVLAENLETDTQIALTATGEIAAIGYVLVFPSSEDGVTGILEGTILPRYRRRGLGARLLSWQISRAIQKAQEFAEKESVVLRLSCEPEDVDCNHLFEKYGMSKLVTQCQMCFDLHRLVPLKDLPADVVVTSYVSERDVEMRQVFNRSFAGHWIGELSMEKWQERFINTQKFRPELTKLAIMDDRVIGFYLTEVFEEQPRHAWLEIIGVLPEHRGHGLGTALTVHALQLYQKAGFEACLLGVDDENITNAKQVYLKLGFVQEKAVRHYAKKIELHAL